MNILVPTLLCTGFSISIAIFTHSVLSIVTSPYPAFRREKHKMSQSELRSHVSAIHIIIFMGERGYIVAAQSASEGGPVRHTPRLPSES